MTDRNAVKRLIETQGPAAARMTFSDAIVTDVIVQGAAVRNCTRDCGGEPCTCGGHGHVHPAHANDREGRNAARRAAFADAARAGVAEAMAKHRRAAHLRTFLQSGRRAR